MSFAASEALSNNCFFSPFAASTMYHFFPSEVSYMYQKRSDFFSQCGSTFKLKIIFCTLLGENRAANA
ncbi:MAG: hypothetical protein B7Z27_04550 [Sphingobacteriia bacterium 32-37-4]|nr:MAG: hypothetical protein B7Z27_04550 [Sphingobacteriia bacterium 32-37-4]